MSAQATVASVPLAAPIQVELQTAERLARATWKPSATTTDRDTHTGPCSGTHTHTHPQLHTHSHRELHTTVENRSSVCSPACLTNPSPLPPLWHSGPGCLTPCTSTSCCCPCSSSSLPPVHSSPQQPLTVGKVVNLMSVAFKLKLKSWVGRSTREGRGEERKLMERLLLSWFASSSSSCAADILSVGPCRQFELISLPPPFPHIKGTHTLAQM